MTQVKHMTVLAFFVALELILAFTPFGMIQIGPLALTLMHIPVILVGIKMGWKEGLMMGFLMGLCSMLKATFAPTVTSFLFSPFVSVAGISGNFASLLLAFGPRLVLGYLAGALPVKSKGLRAGLVTAIHTALVLTLIVLCFGSAYTQALHADASLLYTLLASVIVTNTLPEIILAWAIAAALEKGKLI